MGPACKALMLQHMYAPEGQARGKALPAPVPRPARKRLRKRTAGHATPAVSETEVSPSIKVEPGVAPALLPPHLQVAIGAAAHALHGRAQHSMHSAPKVGQ